MRGAEGAAALVFVLGAACTTDSVRLSHVPNAFAGFDAVTAVGASTPLDGSQSSDPDGLALAYAWKLEAVPVGSKAEIDLPTSRVTAFVPDVEGTYIASLTVSNGDLAARDLVSIYARSSSVAALPDLRIKLDPSICNVDLDRPASNSCGGQGTITVAPVLPALSADVARTARILWTPFRLPAGSGVVDSGTTTPLTLAPMIFVPKAAGEYWISAQLLVGGTISPPAFTSIAVFSGGPPIADRPIPRIDARDLAAPGDRVLFDGTRSMIPPPLQGHPPSFAWSLAVDPSNGRDTFADQATGCPTDQCRVLVPTLKGTYVVALRVGIGETAGASALFALEVK